MNTATIKFKGAVPAGTKKSKAKGGGNKVERGELGIRYPLCDPPYVSGSHL